MPTRLNNYIAAFLLGWILFGCARTPDAPAEEGYRIPDGFPAVEDPEDNAYSALRWDLGRRLFFDKRLSKDHQVSCGSCHKPELAFADELATTKGAFDRPGTRNVPSIANVAYHPYFMREGGVPTLEMQVLVPIQEHNEFAHNIVDICDSLREDPLYAAWSQEAYGRSFDPFVLTRSIAVFERSLLSGGSRYDYYLQGGHSALSSTEQWGRELFFGERTNCSSCHGGFLFTDFGFRNNGQDTALSDIGRERLTGDPADRYRYKTPSLRNVGVTAPYMHKGRFPTLEAVIEHYSSGGVASNYSDPLIRPLGLTRAEQDALVAFLHTLTDERFIAGGWMPGQ